ncbi:MAG: hypothetical protein SFY69_03885 [Planctomycetota bacterium]|nr:hypothetical protein [Planctomycetota bacterium]
MIMWTVVGALLLGVQPGSSHEPGHATPARDPALTNPSDHTRAHDQRRKTLDETPVRPVAGVPEQSSVPGVPAPGGVDLRAPGALPLVEGAALAPRSGTLRRALTGEAVFVPAPGDPPLPPLILLPCAVLEETRGVPDGVGVRIGGQVHRYHGRTYLLPTSFSRETAEVVTVPEPRPQPAPTDAPAEDRVPPPPGNDPSVDDLLRDLETGAPVLPRPDADAAPVAAPLARSRAGTDGRLLMRARGRVMRLSDAQGHFGVVIDNDPDSPGPSRLVLLPCRTLERIEALAAWRGENAAYEVSGRVYTHDGRTYLLPVLVQAARTSDVAPMQ